MYNLISKCLITTINNNLNSNISKTNNILIQKNINNQIRNINIWNKYSKAVETNPLVMKGITNGILCFGADVISQKAFSSTDNDNDSNNYTIYGIDTLRLSKFTFLGVFLSAPALHYWYGFLVRTIPSTNFIGVIQRLALDQLIFAPTFIAIFFTSLGILDGKNTEELKLKLQNDLFSTVLYNYSLWIPAQLINFKLVPPHLQVLYANFVGFFWNIYLSYAGNKIVVKNDKEI